MGFKVKRPFYSSKLLLLCTTNIYSLFLVRVHNQISYWNCNCPLISNYKYSQNHLFLVLLSKWTKTRTVISDDNHTVSIDDKMLGSYDDDEKQLWNFVCLSYFFEMST